MIEPAKTSNNRFYYIALVLLIILGSIERIYGIDRQSLWSDELYAVIASYKKSFFDIWPLLINDSHPPGYVALMYWVFPIVGYSDFGIRLHSLIYGIFWIPLVYWLGRRWFSRDTGLLAAALIASSHSAIYFSQEARAYSMLVAFNLANLICFLEIVFAKEPHRGYYKGFILSSIIILYLHYTCFIFFAAECLLYLLLWAAHQRKGTLTEIAKLFGIPLLVYSPWFGFMYNHLTDTSHAWAVSDKPTADYVYYTFQRLWGPDNNIYILYLYSLIVTLLIALYNHIKGRFIRSAAIIYTLLFLLLVPVLAFYIESLVWTPTFEKRYFLMTCPLIALLLGLIIDRIIQRVISTPWQKIFLLLIIVIISSWIISSNIDKQLYTELNKDPIREAVEVVQKDLGSNAASRDYTVLMTHPGFEHYLRRKHVLFDNQWQYHIYYAPQEVGNVFGYLNARPQINFFYYLSFRQSTSQAATFALKQKYKLLSTAEISVPTGNIDIFKFSAQDAPANDEIATETNATNEIAKSIAKEVGGKSSSTYTTLITHDWMESYLVHNHVQIDTDWNGRYFYMERQLDAVVNYVNNHPAIDTLYYLAFHEPKNQPAVNILKLQYPLLSERMVLVANGAVDIYKLNTRSQPTITTELRELAQQSPLNKLSSLLIKQIGSASPSSYTIITSSQYLLPHIRANNLNLDYKWAEHTYYIDQQAAGVFNYLSTHPTITDLYYVGTDEQATERAEDLLQTQLQLKSKDTLDIAETRINIYHMDTKKAPDNINELRKKLAGNPLYHLSKLTGSDIKRFPSQKYKILLTHDFFQPYLKLHGAQVDLSWNQRFVNRANQAQDILAYLQKTPDIDVIYYLAELDTEAQGAVAVFKNNSREICQTAISSPNLGTLALMKFSLKETPVSSPSAIADCTE